MKEKNTAITEVNEEGIQPFKGYTMEELKYQRTMMALRKEFCKAKVIESVHGLKSRGYGRRQKGGYKSKMAIVGQVASKVFGNLNKLDYILMGISIIGTARKGYKLIRGKK